jgi:MerR family mercuric resistance operon transcriptional regulator
LKRAEHKLTIGEVAAQSGVSIDALRYYERRGLLPRPARTRSGYRLYESRIVDRLSFIKRAQSFGFTLDEIKQMLQLETASPHTCSRVLEMVEHKLEDLNRQYEEIKRLRRELTSYKAECERAIARGQYCPVIEDFVGSL